jgi:hypothetical protein
MGARHARHPAIRGEPVAPCGSGIARAVPLPDRATYNAATISQEGTMFPIHRNARHEAARIERERREAREAKRFPLAGVDGATLDTSPARVSPWVARAQAGQLPASDRTGSLR